MLNQYKLNDIDLLQVNIRVLGVDLNDYSSKPAACRAISRGGLISFGIGQTYFLPAAYSFQFLL
jgi:hypothetical protein